ncbi:MAG TPA: LamG-like jellyroll fold domain-containing protein, partial [Vicinamibacterales bacterium]|nr:LamG-like jellyroll fold domain-containing protein [Vicinamibacterales bacterium]
MITRLLFAALLTVSTVLLALAHAVPHSVKGGDQFLDGIGETALVVRYVLAGDAEDSSRNQMHAALRGSGGTFVEDGQFRRVLLLTGDGSHMQLPGDALAGEDTISVTGWLFLPTGASGPFFDFGQNASTRLFAVANPAGFRASVVVEGKVHGETTATPFLENRWVHLAVVLDPASRVLTSYLDGARAGQATGVAVNAAQIVNQSSASVNRLLIGRSQNDTEPTLHARLRDVRVYRTALTGEQVATIRKNALSGRQFTRGRGAPEPEISTAAIPLESPLASRLSHVPDVTVETVVGTLPRLPYVIPAIHREGGARTDVRVIWPSPTDNGDVMKPGTYTVTGTVPGTRFEPKATVIVKVPVGTTTPPSRLVEAFPLSQVVLERDTQGRDTPFIRNRDKFLRGLAATNPDSFLYNFRDTFGQPQPAGAQPLEGWDSQTTRLRGHGSGHYLTAIAQAYASTTYDEALRASFLQKMNYMIDTLYELSQKAGRPAEDGGPFVADPTAVPPGPERDGYDSNLRAGAIR